MPMKNETIDWLLTQATDAYKLELLVTDKIRDRITSIISATLAPGFGVIAYLATTRRGSLSSLWEIIFFWTLLFCALILLAWASIIVARALLKDFGYARIPSPSALLKYIEEHPNQDAVLNDSRAGLLKEYAFTVEKNHVINQYRKARLLRAQRISFISFVLIFLAFFRYAYNFVWIEQKPQKITLVTPVQIIEEKKPSLPLGIGKPVTILPAPAPAPAQPNNQKFPSIPKP
jgi:hypothetical protein